MKYLLLVMIIITLTSCMDRFKCTVELKTGQVVIIEEARKLEQLTEGETNEDTYSIIDCKKSIRIKFKHYEVNRIIIEPIIVNKYNKE